MSKQETSAGGTVVPAPAFVEALGVWAKIGVLSFGGPAGQIALMHRILVEERKWIDEQRFMPALNFCMLLPGPEATQLATYVGWRMHGVSGGLAAGLLFVLPGAAVMLALSMLYVAFGRVPAVEAVFVGIKAAVLAIVVEALLRISRRALQGGADIAIAAAAFVGIFLLAIPFPVIVAAAALIGFVRGIGQTYAVPATAEPITVTAASTIGTILLWLGIWILPLLAIAGLLGPDHVLAQVAWFFSKLAVVTFGGAYAVLAYMAQAAVEGYGWLDAGEMLDGLGLAETTPGPLILVTQFVGYLAAHHSGGGSPLLLGVLGAAVALWATFVPCFLWIFAFAPYIERLNSEPRLRSALRAVTAAVVGVIFNLAVWFALHVVFADVPERSLGPLRVLVPDAASVSGGALALSLLAIALLFVWRCGIFTMLAACGGLALVWKAIPAGL